MEKWKKLTVLHGGRVLDSNSLENMEVSQMWQKFPGMHAKESSYKNNAQTANFSKDVQNGNKDWLESEPTNEKLNKILSCYSVILCYVLF